MAARPDTNVLADLAESLIRNAPRWDDNEKRVDPDIHRLWVGYGVRVAEGYLALLADHKRLQDELLACDRERREAVERADRFRIEADCAMRDYDTLELFADQAVEVLREIAAGRANKTFDPWAQQRAREAIERFDSLDALSSADTQAAQKEGE